MKYLKQFVNYSRATESRSVRTCEEYVKCIRMFLEHTYPNQNKYSEEQILNITEMDVYDYLCECERNGNSPSNRATKITAIRMFYDFLKRQRVINENPLEFIERPAIPKRDVSCLGLTEAVKLLMRARKQEDNFFRKRDYCILLLFLTSGLRLSELASIKINSIKGNYVSVIGKGNKQRTIPLSPAVLKAIYEWQAVRPEGGEYMFTTRTGCSLSKAGIYQRVKKHIREAGLNKKFSPHTLRHSCSSLMYNYGGCDLRAIQTILGHSDLSTTERYTHVLPSNLVNTVNSNPLASITF